MLTKAELKIIDGGADIRDNPARPSDKTFAPRLLAITTFPRPLASAALTDEALERLLSPPHRVAL